MNQVESQGRTINTKKHNYTINAEDKIVFRIDWKEKDKFDYAVYDIVKLNKHSCTLIEPKSGDIYENVKFNEIRPLNLN